MDFPPGARASRPHSCKGASPAPVGRLTGQPCETNRHDLARSCAGGTPALPGGTTPPVKKSRYLTNFAKGSTQLSSFSEHKGYAHGVTPKRRRLKAAATANWRASSFSYGCSSWPFVLLRGPSWTPSPRTDVGARASSFSYGCSSWPLRGPHSGHSKPCGQRAWKRAARHCFVALRGYLFPFAPLRGLRTDVSYHW